MRIHPQSGYDQPNSIDGLILWVDASEPGTLSRNGTSAVKIFDKSSGGYSLRVQDPIDSPKILQSRFNGKTVIRFSSPPQFMVGDPLEDIDDVLVISVINQQLYVDHVHAITINHKGISIPAIDYVNCIELAEMVVYDCAKLELDEIDFVIEYLCNKWSVTPSHTV